MAPKLISEVMRAEHKRLGTMLMNIISLIEKKSPDVNKKFIEFKWNVEKHFFVEEKAIFEAYSDKVDVGTREVSLIAEHRLMTSMLRDYDKLLSKGKMPDFSEFKKIILHHQQIEDDFFYTGLENNLNEDEKVEILEKTAEIIKV